MAGLLSSVAAAEERRRRLRRWRRRQLTFGGAEEPDYSVFPLTGPGINIPRNWAFQGYQYAAAPMSEASLDVIASGLPAKAAVRGWANSPNDLSSGAPAALGAGAGNKLTWVPKPHADALVTTIQRANARGLVWWLPIFDGVTTYDIEDTWSTRGDAEVHDFLAAVAAWFAARFTPAQLILSPWNESAKSNASQHAAIAAKAYAALRDGAPGHWIGIGPHTYSSDWSSRITDLALTGTSRCFVDVHTYTNPDQTWVDGLGVRASAAEAMGCRLVYGELDPKTTGATTYDSPTNATRLAKIALEFGGCRAAGIPALAWNDTGTTQRCMTFTAPATAGAERSVAWIDDVRSAMVGAP